jgi:hypothetical protein
MRGRESRQSLTQYECPNCSTHVLGKPGLSLGCMNCCCYMRRRRKSTTLVNRTNQKGGPSWRKQISLERTNERLIRR